MTEIEIKAWVDNPEETEKVIRSFAEYTKELHKKDVYWACEKPDADGFIKVRIREDNEGVTVTYKRKEVRGAIEVNDEKEFSISARKDFEVLLADIGFAPYTTKEKQTRVFASTTEGGLPVSIELSYIPPLGWFIELELLANNPDEAFLIRAEAELKAELRRCGIPEEKIEKRFYTELLHG